MAQVIGRRQHSTRYDRVVPNVLPNIIRINPDIKQAGFLTLMANMKTRNITQYKIEWDTINHLPTYTTVAATVSSTTQKTISVTDATIFIPNTLYRNTTTNEILLVESVDRASSTVTFTRQFSYSASSGTAAAVMATGQILYRVGPAMSENHRRQSSVSVVPSGVTNYAQQMRYDLSWTQRQAKTEYLNGDDMPVTERLWIEEARKDMNSTFLFGQKKDTVNEQGEHLTATQGIWDVPTTNILANSGTLYEHDFDEFLLEEVFRQGSSNKMLLASTQVILALGQMTKERIQFNTVPIQIGAGVVVKGGKYTTFAGDTLTVLEDRAISEAYNGSAVIVDMSVLERCIFSNNGISGDFEIHENTQDRDDLGIAKTITADQGIAWGSELFHGKITGVTNGGATSRAI